MQQHRIDMYLLKALKEACNRTVNMYLLKALREACNSTESTCIY